MPISWPVLSLEGQISSKQMNHCFFFLHHPLIGFQNKVINGHVSQLHCFGYGPYWLCRLVGRLRGWGVGGPCWPGHVTSRMVLWYVATGKASKEPALFLGFLLGAEEDDCKVWNLSYNSGSIFLEICFRFQIGKKARILEFPRAYI